MHGGRTYIYILLTLGVKTEQEKTLSGGFEASVPCRMQRRTLREQGRKSISVCVQKQTFEV